MCSLSVRKDPGNEVPLQDHLPKSIFLLLTNPRGFCWLKCRLLHWSSAIQAPYHNHDSQWYNLKIYWAFLLSSGFSWSWMPLIRLFGVCSSWLPQSRPCRLLWLRNNTCLRQKGNSSFLGGRCLSRCGSYSANLIVDALRSHLLMILYTYHKYNENFPRWASTLSKKTINRHPIKQVNT